MIWLSLRAIATLTSVRVVLSLAKLFVSIQVGQTKTEIQMKLKIGINNATNEL